MAKPVRKSYSAAQKSALVAEVERLYRAGGRSYTSIARELGIRDSSYHNWLSQGIKPAPPPAALAAPRVYSPSDRVELVATVERLRGEGQAVDAACRAAGISIKSYRKWREDAAPPLAMRPVTITSLVPTAATALSFVPSRPAALSPPLALVAPGGYRVEGLSIETAAQLLRALS